MEEGLYFKMNISIHAPTRGATRTRTSKTRLTRTFQSTLPRGERLDREKISIELSTISIHAPTRGATTELLNAYNRDIFQSTLPRGERHCKHLYCNCKQQKFQSTLPRGERLPAPLNITTIEGFQSTLPRGERPLIRSRLLTMAWNFNPRSHEGSDSKDGY